jgi:UPF0042 nucleotide-binding protein
LKNIRIVIISGPSGSGKSTALKVLEDIGFFCVDNLPITLIPKFLDLCQQSSGDILKVALVIDIRELGFLKDFPLILKKIKEGGYKVEIVYLESMDEVLVRRFKETRRRHPLSKGESPVQGLTIEREKLGEIKKIADKIIDTSDFTIHELKETFQNYFSTVSESKMTVNFLSFSYRYGIPTDADLMLDVRFLPNPFFVKELKRLNGNDEKVKEFVLNKNETKTFLKKTLELLDFLVDLYKKEGKSYLTIAIGCTGGRHRSVCIANALGAKIKKGENIINTRHRDIDKA